MELRISEQRYLTYKEYVTHDEAGPRIWCLSPSDAGCLGRSAAVRDHDAAFPLTTSDVRSYDLLEPVVRQEARGKLSR
jgi:hypothetical protein